jgi:hypothetical protein
MDISKIEDARKYLDDLTEDGREYYTNNEIINHILF